MSFTDLPKFEETMTSLAAYLMVAHRKHPKLIPGEQDDSLADVRSTIKLRVTQHYTAALLAYGVPAQAPELHRAAEWFATPFPQAGNEDIDAIEMIKLEGLLNLRPEDPYIVPRLKQLVTQRNNRFFVLDRDSTEQDSSDLIFDTLWALKLLLIARDKGVLGGLVSDSEMKKLLNDIIKIGVQDKDLALALRLYFDLTGKLEKAHDDALNGVLKRAVEYQGVWGINNAAKWERLKPIIEAMHKRQLTPGVIDNQVKNLREVILNTCYVIENLAQVANLKPEIRETLYNSLALWWQQFQGDNAPSVLRVMFSEEYDYLLVLCRTLVTVSAFVGEPLGARLWLNPLREMSKKFNANEWAELKSIKLALRRWIGIQVDEPQALKLGLSEANVVRIQPSVFNPTDYNKTDLLRTSLVVKYGPVESIDKERRNYDQLPRRIQPCFVRIPKESYINRKRQQAFVIMEDLSDYHTLFEIYDRLLKNDHARLAVLLGEFLMNIHRGGNGDVNYSTSNHLLDLYLLPMLQHVDFLMNYATQIEKLDLLDGDQRENMDEIQAQLNHLIPGIMQHQKMLERFPLAYMHGDLHTRNVMIRLVQRAGLSRSEADLEFKLIDLESLRMDGDAAHDAGQLLVDLDLLPVSGKKSIHRSVYTRLEALQTDLEGDYMVFAHERGDRHFSTRLELAKARALIRIAKGRAKRSAKSLKIRDYQQAMDAATEVMNLSENAIICLETVYKVLTE